MSDGIVRESWKISSRGEWLDRRRGLMTASRIAVLWDAHPYLTRDQVIAEMMGQNHGDNPAMRRGRILEPAVAEAVKEERPDLTPLRKATTFHTCPDHRLGATPDYVVDRPEGVINIQCKTVNPSTFEQWRGTFPLGYQIQVATENLVLDSITGWLAVLVTSSGYPLHLKEIPRHAAAERRIITDLAAFWADFDAGRLTKAAPSAELAAAYDDGSHIDLSADNELPSLLEDRAALKATVSDADKRLKAIDDTIRERVGAARTAWLPGWLIRLGTIEARAYTVPARSYRRLDVRPTREDEAA
ncbi:MAG TPA: YqaJ viral recombinase family protein [Xanthobacteraceae bacterium]|nr:YqaJ viral recombinase family protein [Xanthobacteraceae bacterium]